MIPDPQQPDGYTDEEWEAYQEGFRSAMAMVASAASVWSASAAGGPVHAMRPPWEDEDEDDVCPECGGEMVSAIGHEDPVCPRCDQL